MRLSLRQTFWWWERSTELPALGSAGVVCCAVAQSLVWNTVGTWLQVGVAGGSAQGRDVLLLLAALL